MAEKLDVGQKRTDQRLDEIHARLVRVFTEASKDLQKKALEHINKYAEKDRQKRADVKAGKMTEAAYKRWLRGQVFIGKQWNAKINQMTQSLIHAEETAAQIIETGQMDCFADNTNYLEYRIDRDMGFQINFTLYDTATVARLVEEEPELLRRRVIDGVKSAAWNQKIIANCITQGIIQGESIQDIVKRMARDTAETDMKALTRYARTAMTAAQNAGRIRAMNNALAKGIYVQKIWMAVGDDRTRDAHLDLDGQTAEVNTPFDSILGPIMYPGDPDASDENVWNCRCSLGYYYPDSAESVSMYGDSGEEYEEWLAEHEAA